MLTLETILLGKVVVEGATGACSPSSIQGSKVTELARLYMTLDHHTCAWAHQEGDNINRM